MSFDSTLAFLSDSKNRGDLFVVLSPPFTASLDIDREVLQEFLDRGGVPESEFRRFAGEIGMMLAALLNGAVDEYVANPSQFLADGSDAFEDEEEVKAAVDRVRDQLYDDRLQQRYDLKKSSKAPSFTDVDWDINIKHFDANLADFTPFPYATCRFSFQRVFEDSAFALFGGKTFDAVQINFSIEEIDHLNRVLLRIRERLQALESEGH